MCAHGNLAEDRRECHGYLSRGPAAPLRACLMRAFVGVGATIGLLEIAARGSAQLKGSVR